MPRIACTRARKPKKWHTQCKWHENMIWAYTNMREPQPHSHKRPMDENEVPRNACTRARKSRQWHIQCNMAKMAYRMQYGLILTWESLSHTHIRGWWMKMKCLEMRAHGHANRGNGICNANVEKMVCKNANGFSAMKCGGKQPRNEAKTHPMHGIVPKHEFWHPKWPIAIPNMHNMDMQWIDSSKAAPK